MAGASTAAPLSAAGALYWNPATMPGLGRSQLEAAAEVIVPQTTMSSAVGPGAFGPGVPPAGLAGQTNSDNGACGLPTIGLVYLPEGSPFSFGLGMYAVAGFGVDYSGSTSNPLFTATPPNGVGFGAVNSYFEVLQIQPSVAYQLTDRLSVAAGPILDMARLRVAPGLFAAPDNANGDLFLTYPQATHAQGNWGAGFIVGAYYQADTWALGASYKSTQWFDTFRFNSTDELGNPRRITLGLDLPAIISVGASCTAVERWLFAVDGRYIDYENTNFLGGEGFLPDASVRGLGWKSIFAVAAGTQYQLSDAISLRCGYSWSDNPVPNSQSFFNTVSPVILQNAIYTGASWNVTEDFALSVAYAHFFKNSISGPIVSPTVGPVPGTSVLNTAIADLVVLGGTVKFGAPRNRSPGGPSMPAGGIEQ